jgi:hypothetical protein
MQVGAELTRTCETHNYELKKTAQERRRSEPFQFGNIVSRAQKICEIFVKSLLEINPGNCLPKYSRTLV